jgi:metal-responsive CopG/Arc/MetJ family transcriptional regulator
MIRTQVQLTEEQARQLKQVAAERGVSLAELIRRAIDRALEEDRMASRRERAVAAVLRGGFRSGKSDISEKHDEYLADAYAE